MTVFQSSQSALIIVLLITLSACSSDSDNPPADIEEDINEVTQDTLDVDEGEDLTDDVPETEDADEVDAPDSDSTDTDQPVMHGAMTRCLDGGPLPGWATYDVANRDLTVNCKDVDLQVVPLTLDTLRVRYIGSVPDPVPDRSYAVVLPPVPELFFLPTIVVGTDTGIRLCSSGMSIDIEEDSCRITVQDLAGETIVHDGPAGGYFEGPGAGGDTNAVWTVGVRRRINADEHYYGFGERNGGLDKHGSIMHFWNSDVPGYGPLQDPLYQSIPFFVGLKGVTAYGVFTDNSYRMRADMGATDSQHYSLSAHGGEIDQYIITGPAILSVVERYTELTGRMELPPKWALGYHQARHGYYPDTMVQEIANGLREHQIPADAIWLDIDYMDEFRVWTWSPEYFPKPAELISNLRDMGLRTVVIIDPGVKVDPNWSVYKEGLDNGYYLNNPNGDPFIGVVWPGDSVYPDFTNPSTRAWWADLVPTMLDVVVEGLWTDMNEPANFDANNNWTVPNWVLADGDGTQMTMAEAHNLYGSNMAQATHEGMVKHLKDKRPFVLTRAGYAGVQRHAAVWTGDIPSTWPALASTLPMLLNMGLSGVTFAGSDVGGWNGGASAELFTRWMQVGAISPFFRNHTQKQAEMQEPWEFGVEAEEISRAAVEERYRLMPYLYTLFALAAQDGTPVLRPMVFEFQDDTATHTIGDQAMLGPWLLVAPVLEAGATERVVYLPKGKWYEARSGAMYQGPALVTLSVRLAALPTLVREGAIVPRRQLVQWTDQSPIDPLYLDLYPTEKHTSFTLYEDDGETLAHHTFGFDTREYSLWQSSDGAFLSFSPYGSGGAYKPPPRNLVMRFRRVDHPPTAVLMNGTPMEAMATNEYDALLEKGSGWLYDERDLSVVVVTPSINYKWGLKVEYDTAVSEDASTVAVHFKVKVPEGTNTTDTIHIALSSNEWSHVPLTWSATEPGVAEGLIPVPRGAWFDYKYTRGNWDTVEKYGDCAEANNRYWFGAAHPVKNDTVPAWADGCQQ